MGWGAWCRQRMLAGHWRAATFALGSSIRRGLGVRCVAVVPAGSRCSPAPPPGQHLAPAARPPALHPEHPPAHPSCARTDPAGTCSSRSSGCLLCTRTTWETRWWWAGRTTGCGPRAAPRRAACRSVPWLPPLGLVGLSVHVCCTARLGFVHAQPALRHVPPSPPRHAPAAVNRRCLPACLPALPFIGGGDCSAQHGAGALGRRAPVVPQRPPQRRVAAQPVPLQQQGRVVQGGWPAGGGVGVGRAAAAAGSRCQGKPCKHCGWLGVAAASPTPTPTTLRP